jgi:hypothetical protein
MWDLISTEMTGLQELKLSLQIEPNYAPYWKCPSGDFLRSVLSAPQMGLRGLQNFILEAPKSDYWDVDQAAKETREFVCL